MRKTSQSEEGKKMAELPFGSEFSPSQIDLPELLEICQENAGNRAAMETAIKNRFFARHGNGSEENRNKLAMNCCLGLRSYQILDENCCFTDLGRTLYSQRDNDEQLYQTLARHILLDLNGMGYVQCLLDMAAAGESITLETIPAALRVRGITYPRAGKHPSIMRLWLEKAGLFPGKKYDVDRERLGQLLGGDDDMDKLRKLTRAQQCFLLALLSTGETEFQSAARIAEAASRSYGVRFSDKSLPKTVLSDIEAAGYIEVQKSTKGRGAKSHLCRPTERARKDVLEPLIGQLENQTDYQLIEMLKKNIPDILADMRAKDTYTKGIALEALGFKLLNILGLDYVATRTRAEATGGNEVDLLFASGVRLYALWQVQCKNTDHVSIEHVTREVGMAQVLHSSVILMITTGTVSEKAKKYADVVMKTTNLNIVFVDKYDIARVAEDPVVFDEIFANKVEAIKALKKVELI